MRKTITIILICVLATVACVSGYKIFQIINEYHSGETTYENLKKYVLTPPTDSETESTDLSDQAATTPEQSIIDFDGLSAINSDIVGWIQLDGTVIDYPIAQCDDNGYYLKHLFNKEANSSGSIFLDCRNNADFSDRNSVLYGHHMKNGSMFSAITNYKNQLFYDEHPAFRLYTPQANYEVAIFAGYVADLQDNAWNTAFEDDDDFSQWLNECMQKSLFQSDIKPSAKDKIVTLSTCSYEFENAKFVVFGAVHEIS